MSAITYNRNTRHKGMRQSGEVGTPGVPEEPSGTLEMSRSRSERCSRPYVSVHRAAHLRFVCFVSERRELLRISNRRYTSKEKKKSPRLGAAFCSRSACRACNSRKGLLPWGKACQGPEATRAPYDGASWLLGAPCAPLTSDRWRI